MADLLYWWGHKDTDVPGSINNMGTVNGSTRISGGPHRSADAARAKARFWLSREGSFHSEYVIYGVEVSYLEVGDALDG